MIDISKIINEKYPLCQIIYSSVYVEYVDYTYESNYVYFIQKKNLGKLLGKALSKARSKYEQEAREKTFEFYSGRVKRYIHLKDIYYLEKNDRVVDVVTLDICLSPSELEDEPLPIAMPAKSTRQSNTGNHFILFLQIFNFLV